jgi:excisionase family DNA binding protein
MTDTKQEDQGAQEKQLLDAMEVADILGITRKTVYEWGMKPEIPLEPVRLGRLIRYRREDVQNLIEHGFALSEDGDEA